MKVFICLYINCFILLSCSNVRKEYLMQGNNNENIENNDFIDLVNKLNLYKEQTGFKGKLGKEIEQRLDDFNNNEEQQVEGLIENIEEEKQIQENLNNKNNIGKKYSKYKTKGQKNNNNIYNNNYKNVLKNSNKKNSIVLNKKINNKKYYSAHDHYITDVLYIKNKNLLITTGWDYFSKLWTIPLKLKKTIEGHKYGVNSVAYNTNLELIATGAGDGRILVCDINGIVKKTLHAHLKRINKVRFLELKNLLLSASCDNTINFWDIKAWKKIHTIRIHKGSVNDFDINFNEKYMISGSSDKTLMLYDILHKKPITIYKKHKNTITAVVFIPNSNKFISCDIVGSILVWDIKNSKLYKTIYINERINNVKFLNDNLLSVSAQNVFLYKFAKNDLILKKKFLNDKKAYINSTCLISNNNQKVLVSVGSNNAITFQDIN